MWVLEIPHLIPITQVQSNWSIKTILQRKKEKRSPYYMLVKNGYVLIKNVIKGTFDITQMHKILQPSYLFVGLKTLGTFIEFIFSF